MFSQYAEAMNINKLDDYYSKSFVLISNGKTYNYAQYKHMQMHDFASLHSLHVRYVSISEKGNKVFAHLKIYLEKKNTKRYLFRVQMMATIHHGKITKIWEKTTPKWEGDVANH